MAQLDQDLFKEVCKNYFYKRRFVSLHVASSLPQKWDTHEIEEREKFALVARRNYNAMCSLLTEFSSINFYIKENPETGTRLTKASFQKLPPLKKVYKKFRTLEDFITEGCIKEDNELLLSSKFVKFFTKILLNKKWFVDIPCLQQRNDDDVVDALEGLENLYYVSMNHPISPTFYDRLRKILKKNLSTLKHFDGISGLDYSKIVPEEAQFETCYVQCKPSDASDKPVLPQFKTKTFLLEGTTLTGFLFQQTTAEKFVIESAGFKRFFEKFASYLSSAAQSMEMESVKNRNLKSIVLNIDFWSRDDVPYFGMFLKELMSYFPKLEKLTVKLNFVARVYGSNWHFLIVSTQGLATFENYFGDFKRLVELYWFEMMKFENIPFEVDFETKFHYESVYEKFPLPDISSMQRIFVDWNVQELDPQSVQVIQEKYPGKAKNCTHITRQIEFGNFKFNIRIKVISLEPSNIIWKNIEHGLHDVFQDASHARQTYIKSYNYCYEFLTFSGMERPVTHSTDSHNTVGMIMYENVRRFITENVAEMLSVCRNLEGDALLNTYSELWKRFELGSDIANGIFSYLNRHWIRRAIEDRHENVHEISHLAKIIWKRNFFDRIREDLESAILNKAKNPHISSFEEIYKQIDEIFGGDSIGFDQIVIQAAIGFVMKSLQHSNGNLVEMEVNQLLANRITTQQLNNLFMFCLRSLLDKGYLKKDEDEEGTVISLV